jgi:hypothetical protein
MVYAINANYYGSQYGWVETGRGGMEAMLGMRWTQVQNEGVVGRQSSAAARAASQYCKMSLQADYMNGADPPGISTDLRQSKKIVWIGCDTFAVAEFR